MTCKDSSYNLILNLLAKCW